MKYQIVTPEEDLTRTLKMIEEMYNPSIVISGINTADCKIFKRGQVWIILHDGTILYYETHSEDYPFFETACHYMLTGKRAAWKTVDELITFRQAIREATVQGTDYCETILQEPLTTRIYQEFMRMARAHDLCHHGCHTF
ncbi:MAG TPA: hypothetical protein VFC67_09355 [Prolixibacteraceae bacterium]|nr:hypothetical protein [Prolixibacteraceae bacterium]